MNQMKQVNLLFGAVMVLRKAYSCLHIVSNCYDGIFTQDVVYFRATMAYDGSTKVNKAGTSVLKI